MHADCNAVVDIADARLDPAAAIEFVSDPGFGGIAMFIGRVRDLNHGRVVTGVSYDMFDALALRGFAAICERTRAQFGPRLKLYIAHAKGRLAVGDLAVVIAAGTPHRDEAFRACRHAIEAVKHTSPIWKQEHYADGDSVWSEGCTLCGADEAADATGAGPALRAAHDHVDDHVGDHVDDHAGAHGHAHDAPAPGRHP